MNPHPVHTFKRNNKYGSSEYRTNKLTKEQNEEFKQLIEPSLKIYTEILASKQTGIAWKRLQYSVAEDVISRFNPALISVDIKADIKESRVLEFVNAINTRIEGISVPTERTGTESSISGSVQGQS